MSFAMQNYKKHFNVASDINTFLNNRTYFLKKETTNMQVDGFKRHISGSGSGKSDWSELLLVFAENVTGFAKGGFEFLGLGVEVAAQRLE